MRVHPARGAEHGPLRLQPDGAEPGHGGPLDAGKGEEAVALLAGSDDATSIEVRGDAHFALDKREDARKDYAEALRKLDVAAPQRQLLEFKLTQAGGAPDTKGTES